MLQTPQDLDLGNAISQVLLDPVIFLEVSFGLRILEYSKETFKPL